MKQMAQEVVRRVDGVTAIDNRVEVWALEAGSPDVAGFSYSDRLALFGISALPMGSSQEHGDNSKSSD